MRVKGKGHGKWVGARRAVHGLALAAALAWLSPCMPAAGRDGDTGDDDPPAEAIGGEWSVTEAMGRAVDPSGGAVLGLDVDAGRMYGNAGCNRVFGELSVGADGSIGFGATGATRMLCPDMATETLVLQAIDRAASWHLAQDGTLEMADREGNTVMRLKR